jgi:uncharacterized membrane protein YfcA
LLSPGLNVSWLMLLFGVIVCSYGARMLVQKGRQPAAPGPLRAGLPWGSAIAGGVLLGLIVVGLGELMLQRMLAHRKFGRPVEAVGAAVLIIFVTSLVAALVRLNGPFMTALVVQHTILVGAMAFAAPGVILGGQLGPKIARRLNARTLQLYVAVLLLLVGALMLLRFLAMTGFMG